MFRVLCAAAAVALVSNVLGMVLNGIGLARPQLIQNVIAMVFNVVANLVLAPRYGPMASAWVTLVTELIVATGSVIALRRRLDFGPALSVSGRPLAACAGLAAVGLLLADRPVVAIPAALVAFLVVVVSLGAWPEELTFRIPGWGSRARA
jgi:O-antigen/teichoic acid export membrane protein